MTTRRRVSKPAIPSIKMMGPNNRPPSSVERVPIVGGVDGGERKDRGREGRGRRMEEKRYNRGKGGRSLEVDSRIFSQLTTKRTVTPKYIRRASL